MAGMGSGYDLSVSTFSPDGRVFQVEYASKAVDNSGTAIAIVCNDGIVFGVEKFLLNKMAVPGTSPRLFAVDRHATIAVAGFLADARQIVEQARQEAREYRRVYEEPIPGKVLSERIALYVHAYTLAWSERPFGAAVLLGVCETAQNLTTGLNEDSGSLINNISSKKADNGLSTDTDSPSQQSPPSNCELYCIEPAGVCYKYFGTAIGKGRQTAKTEIEKLDREGLTCKECLFHTARIIHQIHDEARERDMELEMAWISPDSNMQHEIVPKELIKENEERALKFIEDALDTDMPTS